MIVLLFKVLLIKQKKVFIPNGTYRITKPLTINRGITVCGEHCYNTLLEFDLADNEYCIKINTGYCTLSNFRINPKGYDYEMARKTGACNFNGINCEKQLYTLLKKVMIQGFLTGLYVGDQSWNTDYDSCWIGCCKTGVYSLWGANAVHFTNCKIKDCDIGIDQRGGNSFIISNCDIERNNYGVTLQNQGDTIIENTYFELHANASIRTIWGQQSIDHLTVVGCSFYETEECECIFKFQGQKTAIISVRDCDFRSNAEPNTIYVAVKAVEGVELTPIFLNNRYYDAYVVDDTFISDGSEPVYKQAFTPTIVGTINGVGNIKFEPPVTPDGYTYVGSEFIRTDAGSYNVICYVNAKDKYVAVCTGNEVTVKGYVRFRYIQNKNIAV